MAQYCQHFHPYRLQLIVLSTYRPITLCTGGKTCNEFVTVLGQLRAELGFWLIGWAPMPDHFNLLL